MGSDKRAINETLKQIMRNSGMNAMTVVAPALAAMTFFVLVVSIYYYSDDRGFYEIAQKIFCFMAEYGVSMALLALGVGLVLATGAVDLAVAGILSLAGVVFAILLPWVNVYIAFALVSALGAIIGFVNGGFIARFIAPPMIFTWCVGTLAFVIAAGIAYWAFRHPDLAHVRASVSGINVDPRLKQLLSTQPNLLVAVGLLVAASGLVFRSLNVARHACAVGANRVSAGYTGINVHAIQIGVFTVSGLLASWAGMWLAIMNNEALAASHMGAELIAIATAVLGGAVMTGGYFHPFSIIAAAFFWALMKYSVTAAELPGHLDPIFQSRAPECLAALILIVISAAMGRSLGGRTTTITISTVKADLTNETQGATE